MSSPKKRSFVETAMRYRAIVFLIVFILSLFGIYGLYEMRKNEFPGFTIRQGVVIAVYPGANVQEVEKRVTKPLEDYIFTYGDVQKHKTTSVTRDGMSIIQVQLEDYVNDKDAFWSRFKHGIEGFKMNLPAGVAAIVVMDDFGEASSLLLSLESKNKTYAELSDYLDELTNKLSRLKTVGRINRFGEQKEQISVYLDNERLSHYGLGFKSTALFLAGKGLVNISGTLKDGNTESPIYVESGVNSVRDVEETVIFSTPQGETVRLKDVARVVREYPKPSSYIEQNGNKCVVLSVEMKSGNDVVKMGSEIESVLEEFGKALPEEVKMQRITDQSQVVAHSVFDFLKELLIAIVAVVIVVLLLQPMKVALVAAATIPLSIFISLGIFYAFDFELNTVTLAALIVTLGMIVDNSIVILDDYQEKISEGVSRWRAAADSASHFLKSIFSATLAISITFFPFLYTFKGMIADFVKLFPWALTIVLSVSLLIAVLVVPYLQFAFLKPKNKKPSKFNFEAIAGKIHEKTLKVCFKFPKLTLFCAFLAVCVGLYGMISRPIKLFSTAQRNQFSVEIFMPMGTALEKTAQVADSLEKILSADKRVVSITNFVGASSPRFHLTYAPQFGGSNFAQFIVNTQGVDATEEMIQEYAASYADYFPEAQVRFKQLSYSEAAYPIEVRISGDSLESLQRASEIVSSYLRQLPGVYQVRSSLREPLNGVQVSLNDDAARLGITQMETQALLMARYSSGIPLASIWEGDRNIPVVLKSTHSDKADAAALANEKMPTYGGLGNVPLRQVADLTPVFHVGQIDHRNGRPTVNVTAEVYPEISANDLMMKHGSRIKEWLKGENVDVTFGGETEVVFEQMPRVISALACAVVIIFFILLWHFKNVRTAIMLIGSLALCTFGTGVALNAMHLDFSMTAVLGVVSLLGIMVRNGIIMIDYAEELKKNEHCDAQTAIFNSALRRMRPIFLTSAAASVGVIPMILGGSTLWMPMGGVIFIGTLITMCFILTVLPVLYWKVSGVRVRQRKSV